MGPEVTEDQPAWYQHGGDLWSRGRERPRNKARQSFGGAVRAGPRWRLVV